MPTPPKPRRLKLLQGTYRPDRDHGNGPEFPLTEGAEPPTCVIAEGLDEWHVLTPLLEAQGVLTEADLSILGHLCMLSGRLLDPIT